MSISRSAVDCNSSSAASRLQPCWNSLAPLAESAQHIGNQQDHQDGAQPDAGAAAGTPAAMAVITAATAKNQDQKDDE